MRSLALALLAMTAVACTSGPPQPSCSPGITFVTCSPSGIYGDGAGYWPRPDSDRRMWVAVCGDVGMIESCTDARGERYNGELATCSGGPGLPPVTTPRCLDDSAPRCVQLACPSQSDAGVADSGL